MNEASRRALSAFSPFAAATDAHDRWIKIALFVFWLCLVSYLSWHHVFWRDEVRALSIALKGDNIVEMLRHLHGEGHPALWYLLLRFAYFFVKSPIALPLVSIGIAAATALLLVLRSPFRWWMIALLLLSYFMLFEYSVLARNYGISALLLFLFAWLYPRHRDRGVLLGILLFLLANTNAHSVLLVGALLLFWLVAVVREKGLAWTPELWTFIVNAIISAAGVLVCFLTIYPTYNDAAFANLTGGSIPKLIMTAVLLPSMFFPGLLPGAPAVLDGRVVVVLMSLAMYGSLLGLVRSPGALVAGLAALVGLALFFALIYHGGYRHQALWLVLLVSLYWMSYAPALAPAARIDLQTSPITVVGTALMVLLLAMQAYTGVATVVATAAGAPPLSQVRDLAALVAARSDLRDAIIMADPDYLVEPLPYYMSNRTYLMRERRFGNVVKFTKKARLSIDLGEILATARRLRAESGRPVLVLLHQRLDSAAPHTYHEGYDWELRTTPAQVRAFLASMRFIGHLGPALTDETFDVYLLGGPASNGTQGAAPR